MPSLVSISITFFALRYVSKNWLQGGIRETLTQTRLSTEGRLALGGLVVAAVFLVTASAFGWPLGAPTCGAALFATAVVTWRDRSVPMQIAKGVSWSVLPLVAGLFVIVEALQSAGGLRLAVAGLQTAEKLGGVVGDLATAFAVGTAFQWHEQPTGWTHQRNGRAIGSRAGESCQRGIDWRRSWAKSLCLRISRHYSLANRLKARKRESDWLAVFQSWVGRHAARAPDEHSRD